MTPKDEKTTPGAGRYILAWNIASLSTLVLLTTLHMAIPVALDLAFGLANTDENVLWFLVLEIPIQIAVWLFVWILVYSLFKSLKIRLVMPWLWGVASLGVALNILHTFEAVAEQSQLAIMAPLYLFSLVSEVKIFQAYFKSKGRFVD